MPSASSANHTQLHWSEQSSTAATSLSVLVLFLNLVDGLLTLVFLQLHLAEEANPLMRLAYRGSPIGFILVKLAIVQLGLLVLCSNHRIRLARYALLTGALIYGAIVTYHLAFLARLGLGR